MNSPAKVRYGGKPLGWRKPEGTRKQRQLRAYDDEWDLEGFQQRPIVIAGYIDGILNSLTNENKALWDKRNNASNIKLSGMGEYILIGCNLVVLNEDISMYTL